MLPHRVLRNDVKGGHDGLPEKLFYLFHGKRDLLLVERKRKMNFYPPRFTLFAFEKYIHCTRSPLRTFLRKGERIF